MFLLTYKVPIEEVECVTPAHREFLDRAYKANNLLVSGPQAPRKGGVIVSLVKTRDEVDEIIKSDPFNLEGIADYNVFEFQALKFHPALESLVTK
jgi:uncharacterized protein YciI